MAWLWLSQGSGCSIIEQDAPSPSREASLLNRTEQAAPSVSGLLHR